MSNVRSIDLEPVDGHRGGENGRGTMGGARLLACESVLQLQRMKGWGSIVVGAGEGNPVLPPR